MKRILLLIAALLAFGSMQAQNHKNTVPDAIIGTYQVDHGNEHSRIRIYRAKDGTYCGQCIWLKDSLDHKTGKLRLDVKNPDKNLRNVPCNKIVVIRGVRYNAEKKRWDGGKIYDPTRGIRANCTFEFTADGRLKIRGSVMGIGETLYWTPIKN